MTSAVLTDGAPASEARPSCAQRCTTRCAGGEAMAACGPSLVQFRGRAAAGRRVPRSIGATLPVRCAAAPAAARRLRRVERSDVGTGAQVDRRETYHATPSAQWRALACPLPGGEALITAERAAPTARRLRRAVRGRLTCSYPILAGQAGEPTPIRRSHEAQCVAMVTTGQRAHGSRAAERAVAGERLGAAFEGQIGMAQSASGVGD